MNARGSTEVIVATIGLSMGALSQNLFTMIVAMAILTTLAMPPTPALGARAAADAQGREGAARTRGDGGQGLRVASWSACWSRSTTARNGQFGSRVAGMIAGTRSMPTTVMHITAAKKSKTEAAETSRG